MRLPTSRLAHRNRATRRAALAACTAVALAACAPASRPASSSAASVAPADPRALRSWANGAVFYEVFVRSFYDHDGDGKGDLAGLIDKLDYVRDLGVDALWLMPVFASPSYHGYDTTDYDRINPDYGTNQDFERLCREAHQRGMKIIVDLVLNHTSDKHPWFVASAASPTSPKRDWYVWRNDNPGWGQPWNPNGQTWHSKNGAYYYGLFWSGMPDLNFRNPEVRAEARRIAAEWLGRGVDGFRLDASRHLIETGPGDTGQNDTAETHAYWKELAAFVRQTQPSAILVGENWTESAIIARYYGDTSAVPGGDELPLSFAFPIASGIIGSARQGEASVLAGRIEEVQKRYPPGATWVPFLTNHDMKRVASDLGGDVGKLKTAAAILLTLPGAPFIYYGEELGMQNGPGGEDEQKRTPMAWDGSPSGGFSRGAPWFHFAPGHETANVAAESADPASLYAHYRALIRARHASRALARGHLELVAGEGPVLAYLLSEGDEHVLVVHNLVDDAQTLPVRVHPAGAPVFATPGVTTAPDPAGARVSLPGHGSAVYRLSDT
jgi:glycosidase